MLAHFVKSATTAILMLALAACTLAPNPISKTAVYEAENAYGIAQSAAVAYTALPFCPPGAHASVTLYCKEQPIVVKLAHADATAKAARKALEAFVLNPANYPGLTYGSLWQAFQLAVKAMSQIEADNGVK